jgi:hypothetical protein
VTSPDLGPEWHEVTWNEWRQADRPEKGSYAYLRVDDEDHYFFRVQPAPPLPTEPYTVIRVTWQDGCSPAEVLTLVGDMWGDYTAGNLSRNITGWEPLAEPVVPGTPNIPKWIGDAIRKETAKAVVAEYRQTFAGYRMQHEAVAAKFGVPS